MSSHSSDDLQNSPKPPRNPAGRRRSATVVSVEDALSVRDELESDLDEMGARSLHTEMKKVGEPQHEDEEESATKDSFKTPKVYGPLDSESWTTNPANDSAQSSEEDIPSPTDFDKKGKAKEARVPTPPPPPPKAKANQSWDDLDARIKKAALDRSLESVADRKKTGTSTLPPEAATKDDINLYQAQEAQLIAYHAAKNDGSVPSEITFEQYLGLITDALSNWKIQQSAQKPDKVSATDETPVPKPHKKHDKKAEKTPSTIKPKKVSSKQTVPESTFVKTPINSTQRKVEEELGLTDAKKRVNHFTIEGKNAKTFKMENLEGKSTSREKAKEKRQTTFKVPEPSDSSSSSSSSDSSESEAGPTLLTAYRNVTDDKPNSRRTNAKFAPPQPYSGASGNPTTTTRLKRTTLMWLKSMEVDENSYAALALMDQCFTNDAQEWYGEDVIDSCLDEWPTTHPERYSSPWPFERVFLELEKRFISRTSVRDAELEWMNLTAWNSKGPNKTVLRFITEINKVGKLRNQTTLFEKKKKLLDGLWPKLAYEVAHQVGDIENDYVSWETFTDVALEQERLYSLKESAEEAIREREREEGRPTKLKSNYTSLTNGGPVQAVRRQQRSNSNRNQRSNNTNNDNGNSQNRRNGNQRNDQGDRRLAATGQQQQNQNQNRPNNGNGQRNNNNGNNNGQRRTYTEEERRTYRERTARGQCGKCGSAAHTSRDHGRQGNDRRVGAMHLTPQSSESDPEDADVESEGQESQSEIDEVSQRAEPNEESQSPSSESLFDTEESSDSETTAEDVTTTDPSSSSSDSSSESGSDSAPMFTAEEDSPDEDSEDETNEPALGALRPVRRVLIEDVTNMPEDEEDMQTFYKDDKGNVLNEAGQIIVPSDSSEIPSYRSRRQKKDPDALPEGDLRNEQEERQPAVSAPKTKVKADEKSSTANVSAMKPKKKSGQDEDEPIVDPVLLQVTLNGQPNFNGFTDTGSFASFTAPFIPALLGATTYKYDKPRIISLGTKSSKALVKEYCYMQTEAAGVNALVKYDVANIFTDLIIGRDFLSKYDCLVTVTPPSVVSRDPTASRYVQAKAARARPNQQRRKAERRELEETTAARIEILASMEQRRTINSTLKPAKVSIKTPAQKATHPRVLEKTWLPPKYRPSNYSTRMESPDYVPSQEEKDDFARWIVTEFDDIIIADNDRLPVPPKRDVEHEIPYIDETDPPRPRRTYKVPDKAMTEWNDLHDKHVEAGLWNPVTSRNADPMMPVLKKDGKLRPVVDLKMRNKNTVKLIMPTVDVDYIRTLLAQHRFHLEIDVKGAFQQLLIAVRDVWKTAFQTIYGTYTTPVAQQGDTNSTVTLARMMTYVFTNLIGKMLVTYADNIFGFAKTWTQFWDVASTIMHRCRIHEFYLNANSIRVCPEWVNVLGQRVRYLEIAMNNEQRDAILDMKPPTDKAGCQRFMGCVEWLSAYLPKLAMLAAPITDLCSSSEFRWTKSQQLAFEATRTLLEEARSLTVIDDDLLAPVGTEPVHRLFPPNPAERIQNEHAGQYIFLQTDASESGVAGCLNVGENWWNARNVSNFSRKLSGAQYNYRTHELELLAIYQAFQKFEPRLLGREVIVLTDNKSLEEFLQAKEHTPRQARAYEYLARFNYKIHYLKGKFNHFPDMFSRQFSNETKQIEPNTTLLDLDDEPAHWDETLAAMDRPARTKQLPARFQDPEPEVKRTKKVVSKSESSDTEGDMPQLIPTHDSDEAVVSDAATHGSNSTTTEDQLPATKKGKRKADAPKRTYRHDLQKAHDNVVDLRAEDAVDLPEIGQVSALFKDDFLRRIVELYQDDVDFRKIAAAPHEFSNYFLHEGRIYQIDDEGDRLCIPTGTIDGRSLREIVLEHVHEMTGHVVTASKLVAELHRHFWWPTSTQDAKSYTESCVSCALSTKRTVKPRGKLHQTEIPSKCFAHIGIDFVGTLPLAKWQGQDVNFLCNFVDHLSGEVISVPCFNELSAIESAELYLTFVFPHWGVPSKLFCDRDRRWVSEFWRHFFNGLGTTLGMSTAYHPETNGKMERVHRPMNQIFRHFVEEDQLNWPQQLPFVVFALNSMRSSSSKLSPFEISRTTPPEAVPAWLKSPQGQNKTAREMLERAYITIATARDNIARARIGQAHQANKHRLPDWLSEDFDAAHSEKDAQFYLSTENLSIVANRGRKWTTPFIGPFKLLRFDSDSSTYTLQLPRRLLRRQLRPHFHASQICPAILNDSELFPNRVSPPLPVFPIDEANLFRNTPRALEHPDHRGIRFVRIYRDSHSADNHLVIVGESDQGIQIKYIEGSLEFDQLVADDQSFINVKCNGRPMEALIRTNTVAKRDQFAESQKNTAFYHAQLEEYALQNSVAEKQRRLLQTRAEIRQLEDEEARSTRSSAGSQYSYSGDDAFSASRKRSSEAAAAQGSSPSKRPFIAPSPDSPAQRPYISDAQHATQPYEAEPARAPSVINEGVPEWRPEDDDSRSTAPLPASRPKPAPQPAQKPAQKPADEQQLELDNPTILEYSHEAHAITLDRIITLAKGDRALAARLESTGLTFKFPEEATPVPEQRQRAQTPSLTGLKLNEDQPPAAQVQVAAPIVEQDEEPCPATPDPELHRAAAERAAAIVAKGKASAAQRKEQGQADGQQKQPQVTDDVDSVFAQDRAVVPAVVVGDAAEQVAPPPPESVFSAMSVDQPPLAAVTIQDAQKEQQAVVATTNENGEHHFQLKCVALRSDFVSPAEQLARQADLQEPDFDPLIDGTDSYFERQDKAQLEAIPALL